MTTFLAVPQPGPPARLPASAPSACSLKSEPSDKPEHARAADAQQVAASHLQVRVAEVAAGATSYFDHNLSFA